MKSIKTEKFWIVTFPTAKSRMAYCGTYLTRKDAIKEMEKSLGRPWRELYKAGNRVQKAAIAYVINQQTSN